MIKEEFFEFLPLRRFSNPQAEVEKLINKGFKTHQVYPALNNLNASFIAKMSNRSNITITRSTPVASMGSCFAREIKTSLISNKFNYVQTEHNKWSEHASCAWNRVYSPANALTILKYTDTQELDKNRLYESKSGVIDLLRFKTKYADKKEATEDIINHMKASLNAIKTAKVFILTIGQNEIWQNIEHGFFISQSPPFEIKKNYRLRKFSVTENYEMLTETYNLLKKINPELQVILTVSPVPSTATFFDQNIVVQSFTNKMILRFSVEEFLIKFPDVNYFPSFEIVTCSREWPFKADNRHVKSKTVTNIMNAFLENFTK